MQASCVTAPVGGAGGRGAPLSPSEPWAEPPTPCSLAYCCSLSLVPLT